MSAISFKAKPFKIGSWVIIKLPKDVSSQLPSRGQTMIKGTINGFKFQSPLEPDGKGSHWFRLDKKLQQATGATVGDAVKLEIESTKDWPEPDVPADLQAALDSHPEVKDLWSRITPMARWEWLRWIGSTAKHETRKHRIEVACSKMMRGERRPCCFNRSMCCVPQVSKNGVLKGPE